MTNTTPLYIWNIFKVTFVRAKISCGISVFLLSDACFVTVKMGFHNFPLNVSLVALLLVVVAPPVKAGGSIRAGRFGDLDSIIRTPVENRRVRKDDEEGTTWAVLVAGSYGFGNYRHQADVCHAYQILKKGGLKDENIVVMMYDDIADSIVNPRPGVIINHPNGSDVYAGVPKDYTEDHVTAHNFYAVLLGDKAAIKGGSGKVIDSKPNDRIFIYYTDHGGPGVLGMPNTPFVYANDFIKVLKKKHASGTYREMVIYVESCESGSIFEGLLPENLNIYVTTASDVDEDSWGTYCPGMDPPAPPDFITCLGDLYSVAWMEDSESHNLKKETVKQQYENVKERTSKNNTYNGGSHVKEYGTKGIKAEKLYLFQGFNPATKKLTTNKISSTTMGAINQRDAEILFLWESYKKTEHGSENKGEILKQMTDTMLHRTHLDASMEMIGVFLFGPGKRASSVLKHVRRRGLPIVDDWDCLKSMVRIFETRCGSLTQYGMKHMRAFANICNNGVSQAAMEEACVAACGERHIGQWSPLDQGF